MSTIKDFQLRQIAKDKKVLGSSTRLPRNEFFDTSNITSTRERTDLNIPKYNKIMVDYLKKTREKISSDTIFERIGLENLSEENKIILLEEWKNNPKIEFKSTHYEESFEFKPTYKIKDIKEVTQLIFENTNGIVSKSLLESYDEVRSDIDKLLEAGQIYEIKHSDQEKFISILFPCDEKLNIKVDQEIKNIWRNVKEVSITKDNLSRSLSSYKIKEMEVIKLTDSKRKRDEEKTQKNKKYKETFSNTHLKGKFDFTKIWTKNGPPK